jgi:hypothetical protein
LITCRTVKECRRKPGKFTARKLIQKMMRPPADFSMGVTLVTVQKKKKNMVLFLHKWSILIRTIIKKLIVLS